MVQVSDIWATGQISRSCENGDILSIVSSFNRAWSHHKEDRARFSPNKPIFCVRKKYFFRI